MDELRDDLEALVFRFINPPTRVASLFKGTLSTSAARKQQASARPRPGLGLFGSMALSFGRMRPCTDKRGWMQPYHGYLWPPLIGHGVKPLRSPSVLMRRSTERAGSSTSKIFPLQYW